MIVEWRLFEAGHCLHPEIASRRDGALRPCQFPALATLLRHREHGWLLFDTGYAEHFLHATAPFPERLYRWVTPVRMREDEPLARQLRSAGIAADDIAWILLSHLHGDHVAGVADFPRARIACSDEAWNDLRRRGRFAATRQGFLPALLDSATGRRQSFEASPRARMPAALRGFDPGHDFFGDGSLLLVPLPGHAPGHYGLWFEDGDGPVFLVADAAWSSDALRRGVPPPALVSAWLGDRDAYLQTLARLQALQQAQPSLRIVPSHCRDWRPRGHRDA